MDRSIHLDTISIALPLKYAFFALLSIGVNLGTQCVVLRYVLIAPSYALFAAMAIGTLSGLVCKYVLDKNYIFYYRTSSKKEDAGKFFLYSFMGVFTTVIFWASEITFDYLFGSVYAKYGGAFIGLTVGYTIKYFLDRKYVFNDSVVNPKAC